MHLYFENEYVSFYYDENLSLQIRQWKLKTEQMTIEEWKNISKIGIECLKKYNLKKALNNTQEFRFIVTPDLQQWYNDKIFAEWIKMGGYKVAIVISHELIVQLSIEQNMDEKIAKNNITTFYFDSNEKAIDWLTAD